jgi:hypothetical protein
MPEAQTATIRRLAERILAFHGALRSAIAFLSVSIELLITAGEVKK